MQKKNCDFYDTALWINDELLHNKPLPTIIFSELIGDKIKLYYVAGR